jgi:hypothetical protein
MTQTASKLIREAIAKEELLGYARSTRILRDLLASVEAAEGEMLMAVAKEVVAACWGSSSNGMTAAQRHEWLSLVVARVRGEQ